MYSSRTAADSAKDKWKQASTKIINKAKSYRVTRVPGPWRRETVQKRGDALMAMTPDDVSDLVKASGKYFFFPFY